MIARSARMEIERYFVWDGNVLKVLIYERKWGQEYLRIEYPKRKSA